MGRGDILVGHATFWWCFVTCIGFTRIYFKMAVIPLVPETKMEDVGKLINLRNISARKVTWFVLATMSTTLILSHAFGADRMTRIAYIYSRLPRTHSLHFDFQRQHTLSLSLSLSLSHTHTFWLTETALSLSSFQFPETPWPCQLVRHNSIRITWMRIHSATFFFPVLPFQLGLFQPQTQPQKFRQTPKETNCYIVTYVDSHLHTCTYICRIIHSDKTIKT